MPVVGAGAGAGVEAELTVIGGRYRIHERLGAGGMGVVHRAWDERRGRFVALKTVHGAAGDPCREHFEREYLTLARLHHPRIIEVYDVDVERDTSFYTMELLDGLDVRQLAPLPYKEACACLRDVASSLALLHARRLLHRDVSARNVRVTNGRSKLIDFGALAEFGLPSAVVGTPTCIAPEALDCAPLDARYDLFGLGALAYWLLTRRHPYAGRDVAEIACAWGRPPLPPSVHVEGFHRGDLEGLPPALDELVLSLLSVDRAARPASAAAVIDRLEAIAGLEPDRDIAITDSYLAIAPLVGRQAELARLHRSLRAAMQGAPRAVVVRGDAGIGKTRLLDEFALEARVKGALVAHVDAALCPGDGGTARGIVESLFDAAPQVATAAIRGPAASLPHFAPSIRGTWSGTMPSSHRGSAAARRIHDQETVESFVRHVAEARPVVVIVDGAEHVDSLSAAVLALLSRGQSARLLLVIGESSAAKSAPAAGLARLKRNAETLELEPLETVDERSLLTFLFGDTPQSARLSEWVHRRSAGRPRDAMAVARHLVATGSVRYVHGAWVLPQELPDDTGAATLADVWKGRIDGLPDDARRLATALAILPSAWSVSVAQSFASLLDLPDGLRLIHELVDRGILIAGAENVRFPFEALQRLLEGELVERDRAELHLRAAEAMLRSTKGESPPGGAAAHSKHAAALLEAGWHLIRGGDLKRGLPIVLEVARAFILQSVTFEHTGFRYLEEALERLPPGASHDYERLVLMAPLAVGAYVADRKLGVRWGEAAVAVGSRLSGLSLAGKLRRYTGLRVAATLGLLWAVIRFFGVPKSRRVLSLQEVFFFTLNTVMGLCGAATVCRDVKQVYALSRVIEPLVAFGGFSPGTACHEYCLRLAQVIGGREAESWAGWRALLDHIEDPKAFRWVAESTRILLRGGALHCLGALETYADDPRALERIEALEHCDFILHRAAAAQLRAQWHAHRGEMAEARRWEEEVELHAIQRGSAWQTEVWLAPGLSRMVAKMGDLMGLKRLMELCDSLLPSIPSLEPGALAIRGRYLLLRGELEEAKRVLERAVELMKPHEWTGWAAVRSDLATALSAMGAPSEARALCLRTLEEMRPGDRRFVQLYQGVEIQLAVAESALSEHARAAERLARLIEEQPPEPVPWTIGYLHEVRARVARSAGDTHGFEHHATRTREFYSLTGNTTLLARADALSTEWDGIAALERVQGAVAEDLEAGTSTVMAAFSSQSSSPTCVAPFERTVTLCEAPPTLDEDGVADATLRP